MLNSQLTLAPHVVVFEVGFDSAVGLRAICARTNFLTFFGILRNPEFGTPVHGKFLFVLSCPNSIVTTVVLDILTIDIQLCRLRQVRLIFARGGTYAERS